MFPAVPCRRGGPVEIVKFENRQCVSKRDVTKSVRDAEEEKNIREDIIYMKYQGENTLLLALS